MRQIGQRPSIPRYSMNVEQENFLRAIFWSVQRFRRWFGHQPRHRLGEVGVDHQRVGPVLAGVVRTPTALRPSNRISSTSSFRRDARRPCSVAACAIAADDGAGSRRRG